jgi:histidinol phosphatase-like enzyme
MTGFDGEDLRFKGKCDCRKPNIQLFKDVAEQHSLQLRNATLLGDSENDKYASESAGMRFQQVNSHMDFARDMNIVIDGILNADK